MVISCVLLWAQEPPELRFDETLEVDGGEITLASQAYRRRDGRSLLKLEMPNDGIMVFAVTKEESWLLYGLAQKCVRQCRQLLGEPTGAAAAAPRRQLYFQLVDGPDDPSTVDLDSRWLVTMERSLPTEALAVSISRELVRRRLRQSCRVRRGAPVGAIYDFLGAALVRRMILDDARFVLPREDYVPLRRAFARGRFPDVRKLLETPMPPEAPKALRDLYLSECEVLLSAMESGRDGGTVSHFIEQWMEEANARGCESAVAALEDVLGLAHSPHALQEWFEGQASRVIDNGLGSVDCAECRKELEKLMTIPVLDASASSGIRPIPLRQMPELLPDYRLDGDALGRIQVRLSLLGARAPATLREAILDFQKALDMMVNGDYSGFKREYDRAWEKFLAGEESWGHAMKLLGDESDNEDDRKAATQDWLRTLDFQDELRGDVDRHLFPKEGEGHR